MSVSKVATFFIPPIGVITGSFIGMTAGFFREIRQINDENPNNSEIKRTIDESVKLAGKIYGSIMSMAALLVLPASQPPIWPTVGGAVCVGFSFVAILRIKNIVHDAQNRASLQNNYQKLADAVDSAFKLSIATAVVMSILGALANIRILAHKV